MGDQSSTECTSSWVLDSRAMPWSAHARRFAPANLSRLSTPVFQNLVFSRALVQNICPNLGHGAKPNPIRCIFQILAQGHERIDIRGLVMPWTDIVTHENNPSAVRRRDFYKFLNLEKFHVIEWSSHRLRKVAERRVIRSLVEVPAPHQEPLGHQEPV